MQVLPSSLGYLMCFGVLCKREGINCTLKNFKLLHLVSTSPQNKQFYTFNARPKYAYLMDCPSTLGIRWWNRLFYVRYALRKDEKEEDRRTFDVLKKFIRRKLPKYTPDKDDIPIWMSDMHVDKDPKQQKFFFTMMICQPLPYLVGLGPKCYYGDKKDFGRLIPLCTGQGALLYPFDP